MGSSSSKQSNTMPTGSQVVTPQLPSYMQPYVADVLSRGQELSYQPYTPYQDQRIAGFTPGQTAAQQGILGLQPAGQFNTATQFATQAGLAGLGAYQPAPNVQAPQLSQYTMGPAREVSSRMVRAPQMTAAQTGFAPNLQTFQMEGPERVAAERASTGSFVQPGVASQYMSPYMQNVVDVQKQEAIYDAQKAQLGQNLAAARQGTYGGARQALLQGERESTLSQKLGDIQATGSQAAYEAAQRQFEAEQGRGLQAQQTNIQSQLQAALSNQQARQQAEQQNLAARLGVQELGTRTGLESALANLNTQQQANVQNQAAKLQAQGMNQEQALRAALANQQAGLTIGQQNLSALLGVQALGAQQGMQAGLANQQAELEARRLGLTGAGMGLEAAQALGGLGSAQQAAELQRYGAISGAGAEQQALNQQQLDMRYQDFLRQQQYPMQQLQQYASLLGGVPSPGPSTVSSTYSQPASLASQLAGLGMAGYGAYRTFNSAEGGEIKAYNNGGLVALAEGGGAEQQMGLGAIAPQPMDAPQDVAAPSVEGLGKQARDLVVSTRGDINQINGIPGVPDIVRTMAASMVAKQMSAPQPPDSTVAQKLLNPQPQTAGLASAPLPENAFTAAEGGIVGYGAGDSVKYDYLAPYIPEGVEYTPPKPAGYSIYDVLKKPFASAEEKINEREKLIDFLTATSSEKDKLNERRKLFNKSLPELRAEAEAKGLPILPGVEEINTKQIPQRRQVSDLAGSPSANVRDEELNMGLSAITPTSAPAPQSIGIEQLQEIDKTQIPGRREAPKEDPVARYIESLRKAPSTEMTEEELAKEKQDAFNDFLIAGGFNLMAGQSPNFLAGVGEGLTPAFKGYSEKLDKLAGSKKESRKEQIARDLAIAKAEYDTSRDKEADKLERERIAATQANANKPSDRDTYEQRYYDAQRAKGDKRPEATIRLEAQNEYARQQAQASIFSTDARTAQFEQERLDDAVKEIQAYFSNPLGMAPDQKEYKDPKTSPERRKQLEDERLQYLLGNIGSGANASVGSGGGAQEGDVSTAVNGAPIVFTNGQWRFK